MKQDRIVFFLAMVIILTTASWITSCTHKPNASDFPEICFDRDVLPIFRNNCAISRCHDGGGGRESAMALTNYSEISRSVVPGNPDASRVYRAIIAKGGEGKMPPDQPLSLENRTIIRIWIEQGAGSTTCPAATTTGNDIKTAISNGYLINR